MKKESVLLISISENSFLFQVRTSSKIHSFAFWNNTFSFINDKVRRPYVWHFYLLQNRYECIVKYKIHAIPSSTKKSVQESWPIYFITLPQNKSKYKYTLNEIYVTHIYKKILKPTSSDYFLIYYNNIHLLHDIWCILARAVWHNVMFEDDLLLKYLTRQKLKKNYSQYDDYF